MNSFLERCNDPKDAAYVSTGINFPWTPLVSPTVHYVPYTPFPFIYSRNRSQKQSMGVRVIPTAVTMFYEEFIGTYLF